MFELKGKIMQFIMSEELEKIIEEKNRIARHLKTKIGLVESGVLVPEGLTRDEAIHFGKLGLIYYEFDLEHYKQAYSEYLKNDNFEY